AMHGDVVAGDVALLVDHGEPEGDIEAAGLHVHPFAHGVHGKGLAGEVVEGIIGHPGHAVLPPRRSQAVHDEETATVAELEIVITDHAHGMAAESAHAQVALCGDPGLTPLHVLHEASAHHHADDDGCSLGELLLHGQHAH